MAGTSPAMTLTRHLGAAVIDSDCVAFDDARAEAYHATIAPYLGADGFARIDRRRKARLHAGELKRIIAADRFEDGVAGDAEGGEAVQDWTRKAGGLREGRVAMQRI